MPRFRVEALEKFVVRTVYEVEAATGAEAEGLCRSGQVSYDSAAIEEGDEEWIETVSATPIHATTIRATPTQS
jgi:hypothetical protein